MTTEEKHHAANIRMGDGDFVGRDRTVRGDEVANDKLRGNQITTGDIEGVGVAIGTGASVQIYGDVHYYPIKLRAPLREIFDPLIEDRIRLFGGRDDALNRIAEFIRDPDGGYLVVTAPAGFGKTALMTNLVWETPEAFAYHFFTSTYVSDGLSEDFFLRNVVEQLAQWHGHKGPLPSTLHELSALYHRLLDEPLERTQALVLDGLDEVNIWKLNRYLSRHLPPNLHIILTVRDVGQDWVTEYGLPADQTEHLPLGGLTRDEVAQVLRAAGRGAVVFADDPALLDEVMRVSAYQTDEALGADPFYVRLLAEDAAEGCLTPDNIADQPRGLSAYLDTWWQEIRTIAGDEPVRDLFGTLTVALGPIQRADLEVINPSLADAWTRDFFDDVLHRVRRWVVGDATHGYALVHPRLRQYMHGRIKTDPCQEKLLAYCADWQEHHSSYTLRYYAEHLAEAGQKEALYTLIDKPWMDAKFGRAYSHIAFAEDVSLAIGIAGVEDPPNLVQMVRGCLLYATLGDLATNVPPETLGVLAQVGQVARALGYAALMHDVEMQSRAHLLIGEALAERKESEQAQTVLAQGLKAFKAVRSSSERLDTIGQLAQALVQAGDKGALDKALEAAQAIENQQSKAQALCELAKYAAQAGNTGWALAVAETIEDGESKARAMSGVASALCEAGEVGRAEELADQGVEMALVLEDRHEKAFALREAAIAVARIRGQTGRTEQALHLAEAFPYLNDRVFALNEVARALAQVDEKARAVDIAARALTAADMLEDPTARSRNLSWIAQTQAQAGEKDEALRTIDRALAMVRFIEEEKDKAFALCTIAYVLVQIGEKGQASEVAQQALVSAEAMGHGCSSADVLSDIAKVLVLVGETDKATEVVNRVLRSVEVTPSRWNQAPALSHIALTLARMGEKAKATEVANRALSVIETRDSKATTVVDKAQDCAERERENDTLETVFLAHFVYPELSVLSRLAQALARAGEKERATRIVNQVVAAIEALQSEWGRAPALAELARALAQVGDKTGLDHVLVAAERLRQEPDRAVALSGVAQALAQVGDKYGALEVTNQAWTVAEAINDDERKVIVLSEIAEALCQLSERSRVVEMADQVLSALEAEATDTDYARLDALIKVIQVLSLIGERESAAGTAGRALEAAKTLRDEWDRALALSGVARTLYQLDEGQRALRVLRDAFDHARLAGRDCVFEVLERAAFVLAAIDKGRTLWQVYEAVIEVESWWKN